MCRKGPSRPDGKNCQKPPGANENETYLASLSFFSKGICCVQTSNNNETKELLENQKKKGGLENAFLTRLCVLSDFLSTLSRPEEVLVVLVLL